MLAKIDLSTDTSFSQVVTELHWKKKVTFEGKIHRQFHCLTTLLLLFED